MAACKRGKRWAQRELFERHYQPLYRFLLGQCGDPALAEDLVQDTFVKVLRAISSFRGDARVRSWMTRVALNSFYEATRRRQTANRVLEEYSTRQGAARPGRAADIGPLGRQHGRRELGDLLERALRLLTAEDRSVILLHDLEGYTYEEIAAIADVARGTVGSRLSRARARLRERIRELAGVDPEEKEPVARLMGRKGVDWQGSARSQAGDDTTGPPTSQCSRVSSAPREAGRGMTAPRESGRALTTAPPEGGRGLTAAPRTFLWGTC